MKNRADDLEKLLERQNLEKIFRDEPDFLQRYLQNPEGFIQAVRANPDLQNELFEAQREYYEWYEAHQRAVESHQRAEQSSKEYDEALRQQREVHQATTKGRCDDLVTMVNYDLEHRLGDAQISEDLRRILHPVPQAWLDEIREYMTHAHPDVAQYLFSHCPEVFLSSVPQQQQYSQQQVQYMQHNNNVQHVQCNVPHNTNQYSATLLMEQQHNNMQQQIQHVQQAQHMQQQSHHNNTHELQQQHTTCTDELQHTETGGCTGCEIF